MSRIRKASREEVRQAIMSGITFRPSRKESDTSSSKVKTKAKKKSYITGQHGSGSAKMKANIRQRRARRNQK